MINYISQVKKNAVYCRVLEYKSLYGNQSALSSVHQESVVMYNLYNVHCIQAYCSFRDLFSSMFESTRAKKNLCWESLQAFTHRFLWNLPLFISIYISISEKLNEDIFSNGALFFEPFLLFHFFKTLLTSKMAKLN